MNMLHLLLIIAFALFSLGFAIAATRRHAIIILLGIEIMLHAANLVWMAMWRFGPFAANIDFVFFALFSIAVAAAETAVGLALIIAAYRHFGHVDIQNMGEMKG